MMLDFKARLFFFEERLAHEQNDKGYKNITGTVHKVLMRRVLSDRYRITQENSSTTEYKYD